MSIKLYLQLLADLAWPFKKRGKCRAEFDKSRGYVVQAYLDRNKTKNLKMQKKCILRGHYFLNLPILRLATSKLKLTQ